jgi:uncharacterized membrane protein SirB2
MTDYLALRAVHVTCVGVSYAFFFVRGIWMMRDSPMLARRWVKVLPHLNDTVLLAAAIALAVMLRQYPFVNGWLTAKLLALVLYILLGALALRPGRKKGVRVTAWISAQIVFAYIVAVALARHPAGFLPA